MLPSGSVHWKKPFPTSHFPSGPGPMDTEKPPALGRGHGGRGDKPASVTVRPANVRLWTRLGQLSLVVVVQCVREASSATSPWTDWQLARQKEEKGKGVPIRGRAVERHLASSRTTGCSG